MDDKEFLRRLRLLAKDRAETEGVPVDVAITVAVGSYRDGCPPLDADKLKPFRDFEELTGVPAEDTIHEALDDYAECCLSARVEELAERTGSA
jgi:hypothetical protein